MDSTNKDITIEGKKVLSNEEFGFNAVIQAIDDLNKRLKVLEGK